jgi:hypothetical protein
MNTSDTPAIRLEQNNAGGFTAQTWDVAGNEANFFVRDLTGGSRLPFRIRPGAPTSSIDIAASGNVGIGVASPEANLHVNGASTQDAFIGIGPDPAGNNSAGTGGALNLGYSGGSFGLGSGFFNVRPDANAVAPNPSLRFATSNVQRMIITNTGRVGIGTLAPMQALDVTGNIRASGNFISNATTLAVPDYVFEPGYKLRPLTELAAYVEKEKHLPEIPSAQDMKVQGVNLTEMQMQLLKKVEELTLYTIQQDEQLKKLQSHNKALGNETAQLRARLSALEAAVQDRASR